MVECYLHLYLPPRSIDLLLNEITMRGSFPTREQLLSMAPHEQRVWRRRENAFNRIRSRYEVVCDHVFEDSPIKIALADLLAILEMVNRKRFLQVVGEIPKSYVRTVGEL